MTQQAPWRTTAQELFVASLHAPFGNLIARPWFDTVALRVVAHWFFPLSRLWASADAAHGSVERFFHEANIEPTPRLERRLQKRLERFEAVREDVLENEREWDAAFFGNASISPRTLDKIEFDRLSQRDLFNGLRGMFASLQLFDKVAPIRWQVPTPAEVEADYGGLVADPARAFAVPTEMPEVAVSRSVKHPHGHCYWLRFQSPSRRMNDRVVARVYEPAGVSSPPTLIFGHGICVEFDHWRGLIDEVDAMVAAGIRVVRPEAPWHGRRLPRGRFGGEQFIATAPMGALDLFTSAVREWAVLIDWCRSSAKGPVAIGGSSLGAMTAQLVADKSRDWPQRLRPDAMFLITHCGHIEDAVVHGSLAKVWRIAEATMAKGWTPEMMRKYMPLLDAQGRPVMPPENIVTVLGDHDNVTPFANAEALLDDWNIPASNRFISRRGHFSVPIGMIRDHSSLERFRTVLANC